MSTETIRKQAEQVNIQNNYKIVLICLNTRPCYTKTNRARGMRTDHLSVKSTSGRTALKHVSRLNSKEQGEKKEPRVTRGKVMMQPYNIANAFCKQYSTVNCLSIMRTVSKYVKTAPTLTCFDRIRRVDFQQKLWAQSATVSSYVSQTWQKCRARPNLPGIPYLPWN
jgi:hypothetical protein